MFSLFFLTSFVSWAAPSPTPLSIPESQKISLLSAQKLKLQYDEIQHWIKDPTQQACFKESEIKKKPFCTGQAYCNKLSSNPDTQQLPATLYLNAQGRIVRNQLLVQLELATRACYNSKIRTLAGDATKSAALLSHQRKGERDIKIEKDLKEALQALPNQYEIYR